jgi:4-amino-4-deoxy-L-arabinose transferase-like glycosyltransferase
VLVALAARLAFVLPVRPLPVSDFGWYFERANGIAQGLGYTLHGYPTALWPPGWPYVLAGIVKLFGPSVLAGEIFQAIVNALTAGVVFLIGRELFGRASGIAAGLAYAVLPSAVQWCATLASEPLYTLLWTLATYIWVSRSPRQLGWFALSGIILGADAIIRPSALLYWIVPLAYALAVRREREQFRAWLSAIAVSLVCMVVVITPLIVRNYRVFGTLVIVSNNGGVSLYEGNNPRSSGTDSQLDDPRIQKLLDDPRTEVNGDRLASALAVRYIETHPKRELLLVLRRIKVLYARDDSVIRFTLRSRNYREIVSPPASDRLASALVVVNTVFYYAVMVFALLGLLICFSAFRGGVQNSRWGLLLGLILYNTLIFSILTAVERYRYPTMPYFCAFAGLGVIAAWSYVRGRVIQHAREREGAALGGVRANRVLRNRSRAVPVFDERSQ